MKTEMKTSSQISANPSSGNQLSIVITGAASGIGLETAKKLLVASQYRLALVVKDEVQVKELTKKIEAAEGYVRHRVTFHSCDLADSNAIKLAAEKINAVHRSLFGLVNNAGIYPFGTLQETTPEQWDLTFSVNLKAMFLLSQAFSPSMIKARQGGRIVNISSTAGLLPNHFALAYSVSKAAVIQLTKTLAKELGKDGITVNCVCPGIVRSPMHEVYQPNESKLEEFYAKRGAAYPMGRVGEPSDIAGAIHYFLSPEAGWVTGDVFVMDGGRLLV